MAGQQEIDTIAVDNKNSEFMGDRRSALTSGYPIAAFENKNHMTVSHDGPSVKFEGWRKRGEVPCGVSF